ncbi:SMI1/KNR4 family protein [Saccharopolyspora sp. 6V]|uniref:SMI1/KNR4 family protein n=1 Tax=Saccharopolyspora sp. 6V TaxID=2877239 RepID=UPI001CD7C716|nr:SMI1/KNR4 family protein [Saccharopolyspora sp. 6V]MCA1192384.1 VOC family protein [Saccharopolyspora sp. 6V]
MSQSVPVTLPEWQQFLRGYSDDYLRMATDEEAARLDDVQRENRWLGYEPASEEALRGAEKRLDVRLPPSYRNFLLASNGWRDIDPELSELFRIDEIGWFAEKDPELLTAWTEAGLEGLVEQVKPCLMVSDWSDCAVYWLLDPTTIGPNGEWTAYEWATGDGSYPSPYPSFGALVASARDAFNRWKTHDVIHEQGYQDTEPAPHTRPDAAPLHQVTAADTWPRLMRIDRLDHLVLTVADQDATIDFYTRVLGMEVATSDNGRTALTFGHSKIDLRVAGEDTEVFSAVHPAPGTAELCFVVDTPVLLLIDELREQAGMDIEAGPVGRTGALGPIYSLHLRDPDKNLIKLSNYLD